MNKNITKYIVGGVGALVLMALAGGAMADLVITALPNATSVAAPAGQQKMLLQVGPEGRVLLRGTVDSVGANSLTVKSWGGDWVVNVATSTKLMPGTDISQFKVGDFVGAQGMVKTSAAWTIDASLVRDWTERQQANENRQDIKNMMAKNWQGVASNVNGDAKTLTLTVDGTAYSVSLAANAKVVNNTFITLPFSSIKNGDTVRVYGPAVNGAISAIVVRDVSVK